MYMYDRACVITHFSSVFMTYNTDRNVFSCTAVNQTSSESPILLEITLSILVPLIISLCLVTPLSSSPEDNCPKLCVIQSLASLYSFITCLVLSVLNSIQMNHVEYIL